MNKFMWRVKATWWLWLLSLWSVQGCWEHARVLQSEFYRHLYAKAAVLNDIRTWYD
jgi:hypothetical protein